VALSTTFTQWAPETTKFGKITQNKGHFSVQGHSRSPILVQIESSYTASYIKTNQLAKIHKSSLDTSHSARNCSGFIFDEHLRLLSLTKLQLSPKPVTISITFVNFAVSGLILIRQLPVLLTDFQPLWTDRPIPSSCWAFVFLLWSWTTCNLDLQPKPRWTSNPNI